MNKVKLFIENFLVYGLGGITSKMIPLLMLPIVTRLMPNTAYFGLSDLSNTIVSLCSALAVMGMYDAMYRMFFERDDDGYKKDICSTAFLFTLALSAAVFLLMLLFKEQIAQYFLGNSQYAFLVYISALTTLTSATNSIVSAPTRMQNKRKVFLIANALSPLLSYSISIPLLLKGHYIIALPAAGLLSGLIMEIIFGLLNHKWFHPKRFHIGYLKQMLTIAIPLLPNFLIYWVFNSCDKLMITNLLGVGEAGIYSVGAKLGNASQLIYQAFAGGWQYFAFSTMKEDGQVKTNSMIFEYLGVISFGCSMFVFALAYPVYNLLFTGDYVRGYIASPCLFLAPLLQMLFQVACNQFLVIKKTWPNLFILSGGAAVNVALNFVLIPILGIEGAAIATLAGYAIADIAAVIVLCRMKLMTISRRFIAAVLVMVSYIIWVQTARGMVQINTMAAVGCCGLFLLIYKDDIRKLKIKNTKKSERARLKHMKNQDIRLLEFPQCGDERGHLVVVEGGRDIPFEIKRIFYIYGSDADVVRGQHANRKSEFVLINVAGQSKIRVKDGKGNEAIFALNRPHTGIYLPKMVWKDMYDFSEDSVLLCLSSEHYDSEEYIRDYDEFLQVINKS